MRTSAILAGLALTTGVLTGCSGGGEAAMTDTEAYCEQLRTDEKFFSAVSGADADPSQFGEAVDRLHGLADKAPDEIAEEWGTLDTAFTEVETVLAEAGITPEDLAGLKRGEIPEGVDVSKLRAIGPKIKQLDSPELQDAATTIRKHAKSECGVTMSGS